MGMAPVDSEDRWHTFSCEVCGGHLIDEQNECTRCMRAERDNLRKALSKQRRGSDGVISAQETEIACLQGALLDLEKKPDRFRSVALSFLIWLDAIMPAGPGGPMPLALANIMRENKIDPDREFAEEMAEARRTNRVERWIP